MGAAEVASFLDYLANERGVAVATHQQALAALLFLYRQVLDLELPGLGEIARPQRKRRLPVVLDHGEVMRLFEQLPVEHLLTAQLLYGTGMRILEALRLRVKDIDFAHRDREEVLQYVYQRYGREHAAMVCEHITFRGRSAVRDAARVLGFSVEQANVLSTLADRFSAETTANELRKGVNIETMAGRHYDLDPQSDRPAVPDDPRKKPDEWTAERLLRPEATGQKPEVGSEAGRL